MKSIEKMTIDEKLELVRELLCSLADDFFDSQPGLNCWLSELPDEIESRCK